MPAPYSYDLRSKAIAAVKRGEKKIEVSRFFKISRNTLDLWLKKERETGDYQATRPVGICTDVPWHVSTRSTENSGLRKISRICGRKL